MQIEGSVDGDNWTRLPSSPGVDGDGWVDYCMMGHSPEMYRFLRLTQLGVNSEESHRLDIQYLDFLGTIVDIRKEEPQEEPEH
jgi:hypothetical protein